MRFLQGLSIAETATHKRPPGLGGSAKPAAAPKPGGGFNPYDNTSVSGHEGGNPYDNARSMGQRMQPKTPAAPAPRKPMDLKRLEEWMNIRKRIAEQKKADDDD